MAINANSHPYKVVVGGGTSPIYANRHPIKVEIEGGVVTPAEFEELEKKVDALATDLSYKGGVPTYDDLPADPEQGDVYTVEDTGVLWVWDGTQWVALNDTSSNTIVATTAPTSSTEGEVGQFYVDTTTGKVYVLTAISGNTYNWDLVGPTVVQSAGQSTTDVMSQKATTDMVFSGDRNRKRVNIGSYPGILAESQTTVDGDVCIASYKVQNLHRQKIVAISTQWDNNTGSGVGIRATVDGSSSGTIINGSASNSSFAVVINGSASRSSSAVVIKGSASGAQNSIAVGGNASARARGAIALGKGASATSVGEMNIGADLTEDGYNNTRYRLLTGLYDGQSAHDAATVGQLPATLTNSQFNSILETA